MAAPQAFATPAGARIEVVRGRLGRARAEQLLSFWRREGALDGPATAEERLSEVVCVLLDEAGEVLGTGSAQAGAVEAGGGRRVWVYSRLPRPYAAGGPPRPPPNPQLPPRAGGLPARPPA